LSRVFGEDEGNAAELGQISLPYWQDLKVVNEEVEHDQDL